jgi:hypothetical protein
MRHNQLNVAQELTRLKNDMNSKCVSQAMGTLTQMKWTMDEGTLGERLKGAIMVLD